MSGRAGDAKDDRFGVLGHVAGDLGERRRQDGGEVRGQTPGWPAVPGLATREPLLTTWEAARYLRYRSSSGIRTAVARGELRPHGAGPKGCHLFTLAELERFVAARAARYVRRRHGAHGDRKDASHEERHADPVSGGAPYRRQHVLHPAQGDQPEDRTEEGGGAGSQGNEPAGSGAAARRADGRRQASGRTRPEGSRWGLREVVDRVEGAKARLQHGPDVHGRAGEPHPARAG